MSRRRILAFWVLATCMNPLGALGSTAELNSATASASAQVKLDRKANETLSAPPRAGHPTVKLNRLRLPDNVAKPARVRRELRRILAKLSRNADWGANTGDAIEYRYTVTALETRRSDGVLEVHCEALGQLPKGRQAKGQLTYSGSNKKPWALQLQVLKMVARGVITRLADLERTRRKRPPR